MSPGTAQHERNSVLGFVRNQPFPIGTFTTGAGMTVLTLPFPISVNALFADGKTRRHKSQRYADWLQEAGWALKSQRPDPVRGPVTLLYEVQEGKDNRRR